MSQLIKSMYGDVSCHLFGLSYDQVRTDEVIRNAGWFNSKGEKLGQGDLNLKDLQTIARSIEDNEIFVVLNEADTQWSMPHNMDRSCPGIEYVMSKAKWLASGLPLTAKHFYKINESQTSDITTIHTTQIKYFAGKRSYIFQILEFDGKVFQSVKPAVPINVSTKSYYGLDTYDLPDGTSWAIGDDNQAKAAAKLKAEEQIWAQDVSVFEKFSMLSSDDCHMIMSLIRDFNKRANNIIQKILGPSGIISMATAIYNISLEANLLSIDSKEFESKDVKGLPNGYYAYRIK